MMKKLLMVVMFLGFVTVMKSQNIGKKIRYDIINSFIKHHEIVSNDKQKIYNNFDSYFTIKELTNNYNFNGKRKGIYSIGIHIIPTTRMLLFFYNVNDYYVMPTDSLNVVLSRFISYIKDDSSLTKNNVMKYLESILEITNDNAELEKSLIILPPYNKEK